MSLTLLLEKYDVSTEEGLQKALNEIEKEESEVNESLSNALSRACTLEVRLRAASQTYSKLGEVKNDAEVATDMVDKTADLARDVSAKVRQLDLARSRVAECQRRVHDLIDLRVCSAGVETAIKAQDYETAAAHVSRFLCMEPGSVAAARARGPDPRRDMDAAAATLRERLLRKFEEAAKREDDAAVERLFELFPRIGRAEEGVDLLAGYLASQLEASLRRAGDAPSRGGAVFADALTRALEAGAAALERARRLLPPTPPAPPGLLPRALRALQPPVCSCVRRLSSSLARAPSLAERPDPLLVEPALADLALAHSRMQLYFNFLRRRVEVRPTRRPLPAGRNLRSHRNLSVAAVERERRRSARFGGRGGRREDHRRLRHDAQRPGPAGPVPDAGEILPGGERRQGAEAIDAGARRDRVQPGGRRLLHREEGHQARHLHGQRGRGLRRAERGGRAAGAGGAGAAAAPGLSAARRAAAGRAPGAAAAAAGARGRAVPGARRRGGGRRAVGGAPGAGGGGGGRAAVPGQPAGAGQAALVRGGAGGRGRRLPRRPGAGGGGAAGGAAAGRHGVGRRAGGARRRRRRVGRGGGRAARRPGRAGGGGAGAAAAGGRRAAGRRAGRPAGAGAAPAAAAALRPARRPGGRAALPAPGGLGGRRRAGPARAGGRAGRRRRAAGAGASGPRGGGAGARARAVARRRPGGAGAPRGLRPRRRAAPAPVSEARLLRP